MKVYNIRKLNPDIIIVFLAALQLDPNNDSVKENIRVSGHIDIVGFVING